MKEAQREDPFCIGILNELERTAGPARSASSARDGLSDPQRDRHRVTVRSEQFALDVRDHLLLRKLEDGLLVPVIPRTTYRGALLSRDGGSLRG